MLQFAGFVGCCNPLLTTYGCPVNQPLLPGSIYVDVANTPWQPTPFDGISIKILWQDDQSQAYTALFKAEPGAHLPLHRHRGVEQTFILQGRLVDDEGECTAGNFVWRRPGSVHEAHAPECLLGIGIFQEPNEFLEIPEAEKPQA